MTVDLVLAALLAVAPGPGPIGTDVQAEELAPRVWLITSRSELRGFGAVSSNALLLTGVGESLLIDVPATSGQTLQLLQWAERTLERPVRAVLCTHAHEDRLGGLSAVHGQGIATYGLPLTRTLAAARGLEGPREPLGQDATLSLGGASIQVFFPGPGHSPDNLVVWLPAARVLFGGCLVKDQASTGIGSLLEAEPASWRRALDLLQERYPGAWIVVPGHGRPGGMALLAHTRELLEPVPVE